MLPLMDVAMVLEKSAAVLAERASYFEVRDPMAKSWISIERIPIRPMSKHAIAGGWKM
jgi:hypothetical protein